MSVRQIRTNSVLVDIFDLSREERFFEHEGDMRRSTNYETWRRCEVTFRERVWNERGWRNYYSRFSTVSIRCLPFQPILSAFSCKVARYYISAYGDIVGNVCLFKIQWKLISIYKVIWKLELCQCLSDTCS